jgi:hypothetical protein
MTFFAGQKLRASELNAATTTFILKYLTADFTRTNTTTVADCGILFSNIPAGDYALDGYVVYQATTAGDMRLYWGAASLSRFLWTPRGIATTSTTMSYTGTEGTALGVGPWSFGGSGSADTTLHMSGLVTSSGAGTLGMQVAQVVAAAGTSVVIKAGSWCRLMKLN